MLPILGALLASALSGIFGIGATMAANKYNSPKAQKRRLREAGLPLAYMYQGKVNQQSSVPSLSIDPTFGSSQQNQQKIQRDLADATIPNINADTYLKDTKGTLDNIDLQYWMEQGKPNAKGISKPRREVYNNAILAEKKAESFIRQNEGKLKEIFLGVEQRLFGKGVQVQTKQAELLKIKQQIANLVSQNKLLGQLYDIRELEQMINKSFSNNMDDMSDFEQSLTGLLFQLFSKARL